MARQRIVATSTAAVSVVLAVALVGMINWLGYRHYKRWDWTQSKMYSLSEKSENVLSSLDKDVRVVVFMTPTTPLFDETKELLDRYAAASPHIKVEFIDPDREPLKTQQLAKQFGVTTANTVAFVSGENKKYVNSDQLADYDYSGAQYGQAPKMKAFKGEQQFTAAILAVENPEKPKVCFTTGHGEAALDGFAASGLSQLKDALEKENLETEPVSLLSGSVPDACSAVAVAGPKAPFTQPEIAALKAYLDRGGRLLALLDPVLGADQRPSGLQPLLASFGADVKDDLVVDPSRRLPFFDLSAVYASDFGSHPVVEGMQGLAVLLPVARSVAAGKVEGGEATVLLTTSKDGWGETDLAGILAGKPIAKGPEDVAGPVPLAVAAEEKSNSESQAETGAKPAAEESSKRQWRLVVVGDSDFATNGQLANAGNLNLATNAVDWLVQHNAALGIAPRSPEQVQLFLSASQMRTINLVSLLGLPALAVVLGVGVWWRRRR